jgi:hypothetical protein
MIPRLLILFLVVVTLGTSANAQPSRKTTELLQLLRRRPRGMTVDTWREQRREAARELGRMKERRAVPTLLEIIAEERFDVILEIAIDALGHIGDKRALAPLRKLLSDPSLDGYVRDAVAGALRKLGDDATRATSPIAPPDVTPAPNRNATGSRTGGSRGGQTDIASRLAAGGLIQGDFKELPGLVPTPIDPNVLARSERFDIIFGTADFAWDQAAETTAADVGLGARFVRQVEGKTLAYSVDAAGSASFRIDDPPADDSTSWSIEHSAAAAGETRYYPFQNDLPLLFGQLVGGASYGLTVASPPSANGKRITLGSMITVGGGPGYGRIFDVGPRLRLRRFTRVLRKAGLLARETLPPDVARELLQLWYSLRNTIGSYAPLGYSLRTLSKANMLTRAPDPATIYRLVRILDDPQLFDRRSGMMFRLGYGYARHLVFDGDGSDFASLYGTAEMSLPLGTVRQLDAALRFFWSHVGDPMVYSFNLSGEYNWFLYNRAFDPLGAIGASLDMGLSNQPGSGFGDGGVAYQVLGGAAYTRFFDRGSRIVASLRAGAQRRGAIVLLSIEARYGVSAGSYAQPASD